MKGKKKGENKGKT